MNAQIVLCRNINDGKYLEKSITDLEKLYPSLMSVSIVPVGISDYRKGLYPLKGFDEKSAGEVIDLVEPYQKKFKSMYGTSLVYLADEFYISARRSLPSYEHYETFPQIENGVGLMTCFKKEFYDSLSIFPDNGKTPVRKALATSYIAYDYIKSFKADADKIKNTNCETFKIRNDFFGNKITVTGLLCGRDIINQLKGKFLGEILLLSDSMIKPGSDLFLDDVRICDVEKELNVKVVLVKNDGADLLDCLMM